MSYPACITRWLSSLALALTGLLTSAPAWAVQTLGVVVLHGKESQPGFMEPVAASFRSAGFLVEVPEMPWSRRRLYDATFEQSLDEIGHAVTRLRAQGATKVVLSGLSMGGPAVFGYAATRTGIDGIVAWAPAHDPVNDPAMRAPAFLDAVARAKEAVAAGRGDEAQSFPETQGTAPCAEPAATGGCTPRTGAVRRQRADHPVAAAVAVSLNASTKPALRAAR